MYVCKQNRRHPHRRVHILIVVVSATRQSSRLPRACVRVYARV